MTIRNASELQRVSRREKKRIYRSQESNSFTVKFLPSLRFCALVLLERGVMVCAGGGEAVCKGCVSVKGEGNVEERQRWDEKYLREVSV